MESEGLSIQIPENIILKPNITIFGIGGAGSNAIGNMIESNLQGVSFVVANTDAQSLSNAKCSNKIQLGASSTHGLGAGASPEIGKISAEESVDEIKPYIEGSNMIFITAGMGGGTGTGAAPVIAKIAKELGVLTIGVVTKPFTFEGSRRMKIAEAGIEELEKYVDTLVIVPNQNLFRVANETTTLTDAFKIADDVLYSGVRSITDLIMMPGLINLDFADIKTIMHNTGAAMMGTGEASGENRSIQAAEAAITNPLLDNSFMLGASGVLINITGGKDMTLYEVDNAANRIISEINNDSVHIIFGSTFDDTLEGKIRVSVVATGITESSKACYNKQYLDIYSSSPAKKKSLQNQDLEDSKILQEKTTEQSHIKQSHSTKVDREESFLNTKDSDAFLSQKNDLDIESQDKSDSAFLQKENLDQELVKSEESGLSKIVTSKSEPKTDNFTNKVEDALGEKENNEDNFTDFDVINSAQEQKEIFVPRRQRSFWKSLFRLNRKSETLDQDSVLDYSAEEEELLFSRNNKGNTSNSSVEELPNLRRR